MEERGWRGGGRESGIQIINMGWWILGDLMGGKVADNECIGIFRG